MEELESMNQLERENYFDKLNWEEDDCCEEIPVEEHLRFENLEILFNTLCEGVDEKKAAEKSVKEREEKKIDSNDFIYGEVTFRTFSYLICYIKYKLGIQLRNQIFYDLGSGSGRAVVAAGLTYSFSECIGVELLSELHLFSLKILENLNFMKTNSPSEMLLHLKCPNIRLLQGDILEYNLDFENTSLIFMNCKTFSKDLMKMIANKLKLMPIGVVCITSHQLMTDFDPSWKCLAKLRRLMSWGCANLFIHMKSD